MASYSLYPPIVDEYIPAFKIGDEKIVIQFRLSNLNSSDYFETVQATVYDARTGKNIVRLNDSDGHYRRTGIILNLVPSLVEGNPGLYQIEILENDINASSFNELGLTYKIQLRLSQRTYQTSEGGQADWINFNAGSFSEWSTVIYTTSLQEINYRLNIDSHTLGYSYPSDFLTVSGTFDPVPSSEVVEECNFILCDNQGNEIEKGEIIKMENTQSFIYTFSTELENNTQYIVKFNYITRNLYQEEVDIILNVRYETQSELDYALKTIEDGISGTSLITEEEEGYIAFKIKPTNNNFLDGRDTYSNQIYTIDIKRSDSNSLFKKWITVKQVIGSVDTIEKLPIIIDNSIESQVFYQYKMQIIKINDDDQISLSFGETQKIIRDFDNTFLLGDQRQLKLKFNNNINSFNHQVVESKQDSLGGKYPIITRNTASYYKTFPITGTISFQMDEQNLFYSQDEIYGSEEIKNLYRNKYYQNQTSNKLNINTYDYYYEKKFREKVIEFLYDGKIKLFKSPTEGNILIRIMNVSFTPNQSLSRMIYDFSCTAYEIGEVNIDNLLDNNIINFVYDENSIIPEPPTPEPEPNYKKGYIVSETIDSEVKIIGVEEEIYNPEVQIIDSNNVTYYNNF